MISPVRCAAFLAIACLACHAGEWSSREVDGRVEGWHGERLQAAWQKTQVTPPRRGERFRNNAFFHPLATPRGFVWTDCHPSDHPHHSGLWWPWKSVEVGGKRYVTWEIQKGQGAHVCRDVRLVARGPDFLEWEFLNETVIRKPGRDAGPPAVDGIPVIRETARVRLARHGGDSNVLDVSLHQVPLGDEPVHLPRHRYSGFTWRGPKTWNAGASRLITSEGHTRRDANGKPARWAMMTGPGAADRQATVLVMSAAIDLAGEPERLRVWNVLMFGGVPFVNFNPVAEKKLTLDANSPAVARRSYRVIAADRAITAVEAEALWQAWRGK